MCDGVVITVVQGVTKLQSVTEVRQQLSMANANIIGFVMEGPRSE
jgi:Mrp family chromosome partitioning ATPase